jgi:DnaJ family protein B protein 12
MDGNKDEAVKCLKIGKQALEGGDRMRALKFITKARRLDPALPVDDLLSAIENESNGPADRPAQYSNGPAKGPSESPPSSKPADQPSLRHRVPPAGPSSSTSASYTEEQIAVVRQIKKLLRDSGVGEDLHRRRRAKSLSKTLFEGPPR